MFLKTSFRTKLKSLTINLPTDENVNYIILKNRSKFTVRYYANPTEHNKEMFFIK